MRVHTGLAALAVMLSAQPALAADINKRFIVEVDPIAPASAAYEQKVNDVTTNKWGGLADFNLGNLLSTGPEFWTGTFLMKGPSDETTAYRREDFWPGERQKIDAIRLRWTLARWENPASMRGWFVKGAYNYTRINSRANRYVSTSGEGDAVPVTVSAAPSEETDLVTDIRHGVSLAFGNRWLLTDQKFSIDLGASFLRNFKRSVTVDAKNPNARADYDDAIESLPDTRMDTRPTPEINLGMGYAF
jgi:hypothetical protein